MMTHTTAHSNAARQRASHAPCGRVVTMRRAAAAIATLGVILCWSATASAQLDPLLFLKRVPPTVIVVIDTSLRMLEDGNGNFYDPQFYSTTADPAVMSAFPSISPSTTKTYRRVFRNLKYESSGYSATTISATPAVWDPASPLTSNAPADLAFLDPTRYGIAKAGIISAVSENSDNSTRWGLVRLRQSSPLWRTGANCDKPVVSLDLSQSLVSDSNPCAAGILPGRYGMYPGTVAAASYAQASAPPGTIMVIPANGSGTTVLNLVRRATGDNLGLVPAGIGGVGFEDRPINRALQDARSVAIAVMNADAASCRTCRNTVVVLITGGKDDGNAAYQAANDPTTTATTFMNVVAGTVTKRVPIVVVGVKPAVADETELQAIANNSGGVYRRATTANDVASAINHAVQMGYSRAGDFDTGASSEYAVVSPIVGTVNLVNARSATGAALPNTEIEHVVTSQVLPQRSNMMITAGFALPGFDGRIRAFRTYVPETDSTKAIGWKFVNDGTPLWPDLDGRPSLAGQARAPLNPDNRNIYTFVPNASGGGSVVAFTVANAATLQPHMNVTDAATLIGFVRAQPLGGVIGSTPALMDPPSLDPPPDDDYGRTDTADTFAGNHKKRRGIIFVGANDGMIHAIDARTGYEVWAFIPYNLLPKLRALVDGQPVIQFDYFVDSSPKIAEVKLDPSNPNKALRWRSMLIIGQGQGGTFYQAFDVTEAGMGVEPDLGDIGAVNSLLGHFDSPNESIVFKWAYPNYSSFDPSYTAALSVFDATPGRRVKMFGDLKASASYAEKTVGFTWSDPAVGPLKADRTLTAVITGSGYFPDIEASLPGRGAGAPKAGQTMYLIDAATGTLIGNPSGAACSGTGCISVGDIAANNRKNALQADPTAAGENSHHVVTKAYIGDIDGKYWRFNFNDTGTLTMSEMVNTGAPIYASSALLFVGSTDVYMFFATGSDLLPATAPGGAGTFRLYGLKDNTPATGATTKFATDLADVSFTGLFTTGERPSTAPSVAGDIVFYTTTTELATAPCADYVANLYGLTYAGGAAYDADDSGKIDPNETPIAKSVSGRATAPFIVDQHLYFGTIGVGGAAVEAFGDPEDFNNGIGQVGVRILSWREIR